MACMQDYVRAIFQNYYDQKRTCKHAASEEAQIECLIQDVLQRRKHRREKHIPQQSKFISSCPWPEKHTEGVTNLCMWMKSLNKNGFFTSAKVEEKARRRITSKTMLYDYHIRLRCIEYQRTRKCKATIWAKRVEKTKAWHIQYQGVHNHDVLSSHGQMRNHHFLLKQLTSYK